ncbi:hypothetical protein D3C81_1830420 [compost metagenome]
MALQQTSAQFKTADIRQSDVEDYRIRASLTRAFQHRQSTLKRFHAKTFLLQHVDKRIRDTLLILNQPDQRLLHFASLLLPPRHDGHRADGIFRRTVDNLVGIGQIRQRVAFFIIKTHHL